MITYYILDNIWEGFFINKQLYLLLGLILTLPSTSMIGAKANSAQYSFYGSMASGVILTDEDSPIEVTSEELVFNIHELPPSRDLELATYESNVSATYHFYNPADFDAHARLVFPLGDIPSYVNGDDYETMIESYDIQLDGVVAPHQIRHTYQHYAETFNVSRDITRLRDTKVNDVFFNDTLAVYHYTVTIDALSTMTESAISLVVPRSYAGYIFTDAYFWTKEVGTKYEIQLSAKEGQLFHLYFLDVDFTNLATSFKLYDTFYDANEFNYTAAVIGNQIPFNDLIMADYDPESIISEVDYYNAEIDMLNLRFKPAGNLKFGWTRLFDLRSDLLVWFDYNMTVLSKQTVVNQVTAPLFPAIREDYEPSVYDFTYLLTPASTWAAFGELTIEIKTDLYLISSSLPGFSDEVDGYRLELVTLPETELTFRLSESREPKLHNYGMDTLMMVLAIFAALGAMIIVPLIISLVTAGIIILIIHNVSKRKKQP